MSEERVILFCKPSGVALGIAVCFIISTVSGCGLDPRSLRHRLPADSSTDITPPPVLPPPPPPPPPPPSSTPSFLRQMGTLTIPSGTANGDEIVNAMKIDNAGNIVIAGSTSGSLVEPSGLGRDVFIAKFNAFGVLQWLRQLGSLTISTPGDKGDENVAGVALDSGGNIYVTGFTLGNFGEARGGSWDAFVAKFDANGAFQWVKQMGQVSFPGGSNTDDWANGIAIDSLDHVYIVGRTFGSLGEANAGFGDVFIAKLDSNGNFMWVRQMGSVTTGPSANALDHPSSISVDSHDDVILSGYTNGSLGELNSGAYDAFVAKYSSSGVFQWVRQMGNITMGIAASKNEVVSGLVLDSSDNIFISGSTNGSLGESFGGSFDGFIAKYSATGVFQWVRQMGNITRSGGRASKDDVVTGITLDPIGNIFISGYTLGALGEINGGSNDVFIAKYDSGGVYQWVRQLGENTMGGPASDFDDLAYGITSDLGGNIYVAGSTYGSLKEPNAGNGDAFLGKFTPTGMIDLTL